MLPQQIITLAMAMLSGTTFASALPAEDALSLEVRSTESVVSINCGARWGVDNNVGALQIAHDSIPSSGQSCHAKPSCAPITQPACDDGVKIGWCGPPSGQPKQCVGYALLRDRVNQIKDYCLSETHGQTFTGQGFYKDGSNVIIQTC